MKREKTRSGRKKLSISCGSVQKIGLNILVNLLKILAKILRSKEMFGIIC